MHRSPVLLLAVLLALPPAALLAQDAEMAAPPPPLPGPSATDLQMRLNALETQLRNVTGQLERSQYQNNQLQQTLQRMNADYDGRFQMLERRVGAQEARQMAPPPPPPQAAPTLTTPQMPPAAPAQGAATDAPPPAPPKEGVLGTISSSSGKSGDPQALYDQAFQAMRQAKYDDAESLFRDFLKNHPKHRLAENAKYWLGETYYVRGKFQDAAVTFGEGFQQFPNGNKAPDNLLKLAMALGSVNKKQDACTTLTELKKRFPNASAIIRNRAEQEKKTLACT